MSTGQVWHTVPQKWHFGVSTSVPHPDPGAGWPHPVPAMQHSHLEQGSKVRKAEKNPKEPSQAAATHLPQLEQLCCHLQGCEGHNEPPRPCPGVSRFGQSTAGVCLCEITEVFRKGSFADFPSCDPTCHRCERTLHSSKQINNSLPTLT